MAEEAVHTHGNKRSLFHSRALFLINFSNSGRFYSQLPMQTKKKYWQRTNEYGRAACFVKKLNLKQDNSLAGTKVIKHV